MTLPVATHRVKVERLPDQSGVDPWEGGPEPELVTVVEGLRAVISIGTGGLAGTETPTSEVIRFTMLADPCDLTYLDVVTDEDSGQRYSVQWVVPSPGIAGLANVKAGLSTYRGFGQEETS